MYVLVRSGAFSNHLSPKWYHCHFSEKALSKCSDRFLMCGKSSRTRTATTAAVSPRFVPASVARPTLAITERQRIRYLAQRHPAPNAESERLRSGSGAQMKLGRSSGSVVRRCATFQSSAGWLRSIILSDPARPGVRAVLRVVVSDRVRDGAACPRLYLHALPRHVGDRACARQYATVAVM
jgi:hypothetical protein